MLEWRLLFGDYQHLNHIDKNLSHVRNQKILANIRSLVYFFIFIEQWGHYYSHFMLISLHHYLKCRIYIHFWQNICLSGSIIGIVKEKLACFHFPDVRIDIHFQLSKCCSICFSVSDYHIFSYVIHGINRPLSKIPIVTFLYLWLRLT